MNYPYNATSLLLEGKERQQLILLEAHKTGFGILIEQDGYVDLSLNPGIIKEGFDVSSTGTITVNCILQKANTLNRNGRVYPRNVLQREDERYQQLMRDQSAVGECNHPSEISVDLGNIAHRVVKTWWEGDTLYGKLEIIVSPQFASRGEVSCMVGDKIAHYLRLGIKLGISSRGLGSVKPFQGKNVVQDDFELVCYDLVSSPSTPNAYLFSDNEKPVTGMNESVDVTPSGILKKATFFDNKLANFLKNKQR